MSPGECNDKIRFSLSDDSSVLCFEAFAIMDAPECRIVEQELRAHLVGRPLSEVDMGYIRSLACDGDGVCLRAVIRAIEEHQQLFLGTRNER